MGQFTGLFKELDNTEKKPTKAKTNKTAQTSAAKKTVEAAAATPAKVLETSKSQAGSQEADQRQHRENGNARTDARQAQPPGLYTSPRFCPKRHL